MISFIIIWLLTTIASVCCFDFHERALGLVALPPSIADSSGENATVLISVLNNLHRLLIGRFHNTSQSMTALHSNVSIIGSSLVSTLTTIANIQADSFAICYDSKIHLLYVVLNSTSVYHVNVTTMESGYLTIAGAYCLSPD